MFFLIMVHVNNNNHGAFEIRTHSIKVLTYFDVEFKFLVSMKVYVRL